MRLPTTAHTSIPRRIHELRMAALVKPNGRFRRLYRAAIASFRHLAVCPALTRQRERAWRSHLERTSR
jgi:hypothetical protein